MARIYTLWGGISEVWSICASWGLWKWIFHGALDKEASRNPDVLSSWWCDQISNRMSKYCYLASWEGLWTDSWAKGQSTSTSPDVVELQTPLAIAIDGKRWGELEDHTLRLLIIKKNLSVFLFRPWTKLINYQSRLESWDGCQINLRGGREIYMGIIDFWLYSEARFNQIT